MFPVTNMETIKKMSHCDYNTFCDAGFLSVRFREDGPHTAALYQSRSTMCGLCKQSFPYRETWIFIPGDRTRLIFNDNDILETNYKNLEKACLVCIPCAKTINFQKDYIIEGLKHPINITPTFQELLVSKGWPNCGECGDKKPTHVNLVYYRKEYCCLQKQSIKKKTLYR